LSVAEIMARVDSPERTLGIHFFNPPVAMRLVEMVRTDKTGQEAFHAAWDFLLTALRRTPVDVKDVPGFIVNRTMRPYYVASQRLANAATGFSAIDEACRTLGGVPMGPFELMDLIGLDTNLAITKSIYEALGRPERFLPPALQQELVAAGSVGRKSGNGFYRYDNGKKTAENPMAAGLLGAGPALSAGDIWKKLRDALISEAERVVSEGTASATDVDTAIKLAMNFPKGPFEWRKESTAA
jgi:3-hydroxybutyryl-CoA dehydrogenase